MTTYKLMINTFGICTHFTHGVVSGVPHRVVLPNATQIQARMLGLRDEPRVLYYTIPHFPQLDSFGTVMTAADILREGDVLIGARLQVLNCKDTQVEYGEPAPKLTHFDPDYSFSDDVVLDGRAALYLDIYGGRVSYKGPGRPGGAGYVTIDMETDGLPVLLVTPLAPWKGRSPSSHRITLAEPTDPSQPIMLNVNNVELQREQPAQEQFGAYDFMLHYLTARGGVPISIAHKTPGMPDPTSVTAGRMADALAQLAWVVATADDGPRQLQHFEDLTPSCSPSQYP